VKVSDVAERKWRIICAGPVRVIVELSYKGWKVAGREVNLTSRMTQWAGKHGFEHRITTENADGLTLVTGVVRHPGLQEKILEPTANEPALVRAWWGPQVVEEGPTATSIHNLADQNLGLAIIVSGRASKPAPDDPLNLLVQPQLVNDSASWYVVGVWDQEQNENLTVNATNPASRYRNGSLVLPASGPKTATAFFDQVSDIRQRIMNPAQVNFLSQVAAPQSAPPDTRQPARSKTYSAAIDLLRIAAERTAQKWEPIMAKSPAAEVGRDNGQGFFTEGDNQTGEWKEQKDFIGPAISGSANSGSFTPGLKTNAFGAGRNRGTRACLAKR